MGDDWSNGYGMGWIDEQNLKRILIESETGLQGSLASKYKRILNSEELSFDTLTFRPMSLL
jgi:hypothetical protein